MAWNLISTEILNKLGTTNIYVSRALQNDVHAVIPAQIPLDDSLLAVKVRVRKPSQLIEIAIRKHQALHVAGLDPVHRVLVSFVTLLCQFLAVPEEVGAGAGQARDPWVLSHSGRLDFSELFIDG